MRRASFAPSPASHKAHTHSPDGCVGAAPQTPLARTSHTPHRSARTALLARRQLTTHERRRCTADTAHVDTAPPPTPRGLRLTSVGAGGGGGGGVRQAAAADGAQLRPARRSTAAVEGKEAAAAALDQLTLRRRSIAAAAAATCRRSRRDAAGPIDSKTNAPRVERPGAGRPSRSPRHRENAGRWAANADCSALGRRCRLPWPGSVDRWAVDSQPQVGARRRLPRRADSSAMPPEPPPEIPRHHDIPAEPTTPRTSANTAGHGEHLGEKYPATPSNAA